MNGPSEKAVEAADRAFGPDPLDAPDSMAPVLAAAHDPALGLDRSVCLRDTVEALRRYQIERGFVVTHGEADFLEREFGVES